MPNHYEEVASIQVRQGNSTTTLSQRYGAVTGGWNWAAYPPGTGALAMALMRACMSSGGTGGAGTMGTWTNGNTIMVGMAGGSCGVSHRRKLGYEWGYWRSWWQNFECGVSGSASFYSGQFRFNIPTPPAGARLVISRVRIYEAGYNNVSTHNVSIGGGSLDFTPPTYSRPTGGSSCPDPVPPCWMGYWPWWYSLASGGGGGSYRTYYAQLELVYEYTPEDPECKDIDATDITANGGILSGGPGTSWQWGIKGDDIGDISDDGILTGLTADTWYWYRALSYCTTKTFWFKTKKTDDPTTWAASIITLPATEVWATGATIHGLFHYKGDSAFYVYLGFQYGTDSDVSSEHIYWLYSLGLPAKDWGPRGFMMPIQMTIAGLLPDTTYNYRACLHVHNPNGTLIPMNTNNYFGATLSFGGPVSMFGFGREYATAKKAEDDVSRMAAGRYYMDKEGVFQYESYQRRKT